jgi:cell pole-organizing protein PopZ
MTQSAKAQEPSMDEILASIRRLIAHDDPANPAPPAGEPARPAAEPVRNEAARAWPRSQAADPRPGQGPEPLKQPQLLSPATAAAVDSALDALAQAAAAHSPRTLEDIARDLLRPMLKTWLDDNLPQLVERLVRAEIEQLSRGR